MQDINATIGGGYDLNDEQKRVAAGLRGQQQSGNFLGLSTIDQVSGLGQNMSLNANRAAKTAGGLAKSRHEMEARQGEAQTDREYRMEAARKLAEAQKARDTELRTYREGKDATDAELRREEIASRKEIAKQRAIADAQQRGGWTEENGIAGSKPSAKEKEGFNLGLQTAKTVTDFAPFLKSMTPEQFDQVNQVAVPMATRMVGGGIERWVNENVAYKDPAVRDFLTKGAYIENAFSRAFSGLAVTVFENSKREEWSPFVTGISQQERLQRLGNLNHELEKGMQTFTGTYGTKWNNVRQSLDGGTDEASLNEITPEDIQDGVLPEDADNTLDALISHAQGQKKKPAKVGDIYGAEYIDNLDEAGLEDYIKRLESGKQ